MLYRIFYIFVGINIILILSNFTGWSHLTPTQLWWRWWPVKPWNNAEPSGGGFPFQKNVIQPHMIHLWFPFQETSKTCDFRGQKAGRQIRPIFRHPGFDRKLPVLRQRWKPSCHVCNGHWKLEENPRDELYISLWTQQRPGLWKEMGDPEIRWIAWFVTFVYHT